MTPTMNRRKASSPQRKTRAARARYVLCIKNDGYTASLEKRKLYRTLPDASANTHNLIRVVDESGEDYLYPAKWFVAITLPQTIARALALAA